MKVILKRLTLTNFRGVRSLSTDFDANTSIYGDNQTGKTTIYNAFLWLLFGKDNLDRKDFEIKTLGPDNQPYHRLDHEVSADLTIDGISTNLKRTYREKWVKKKGSTEAEFSGHETLLFWNEVPYKLEDFQAKVNGILKENVFKMITSTGYFNSMKWQDRRSILLELAGNIKDIDLLHELSEKYDGKYNALIKAMDGGKSLEEYKRELSNKKKKIKDELDLMPARIDEANRSLPEEANYKALSLQLAEVKERMENIDMLLMDKTNSQKQQQEILSSKIRKIGDLKVSLNGIEFHIKNAVRDRRQEREQVLIDAKRELQQLNDSYTRGNIDIDAEKNRKVRMEAEKTQLTEKWHATNNEQLKFNEGEFHCPTCKREYEASGVEAKKEELTRNFNQNKSERLGKITEAGKKLAGDIEAIGIKITKLQSETNATLAAIKEKTSSIDELQQQHQELTTNENTSIVNDINSNKQHQATKAEIAALEAEVNAPQQEDDKKQEWLQTKRELTAKIDSLNKELSSKDQRQKGLARIAELTSNESQMANELASFEKIEFSIYEFTRAKMDEMEARINDRFKMVKFKMFREQVNGGQEECCETLINGVPFGVANTASQINAGLDIINVMSDHFDIHAPVFVDNRESVVTLIPSSSQIINLVVVQGALLSVNKIKYRKDFKPALELV